MTRPADNSLARDYLRDLIVDIRCAKRDGLTQYAADCTAKLQKLWSARHSPVIDKYGMFVTPKPHDIGQSNADQNEYWQRVGGHPPPGYQDID